MCGIYGFVSAEGPLGPSEQVGRILGAMAQALYHRGPDDMGTCVDSFAAIGIRRLAIIDPHGGHQPISNEDRSVWVVCNGEIYNCGSLRQELIARGHRFSTASDVETIVHLYEERGREFVEALDGMFAIAVWDRGQQRLTLARDRVGIKPLFFCETPSGLVFASELKALIMHPAIERRVSADALAYYLTYGVTPPDGGMLQGVKKLEPAHTPTFGGGQSVRRRYWQLRAPLRDLTLADAAQEVRQRVRMAVRTHLMSDVPVGAFLSGGIDSATIVGTMVELGVRPKTFSIGFDDRQFNELNFARQIAHHFGTEHHEAILRPDFWSLMDQLPLVLDEPFADVSAVPTYLLAKLAAEQVKVVLTGDGGDEVFAGYDRYVDVLAEARRLDRFPLGLRGLLAVVAGTLPRSFPGKHWLYHASLPFERRFIEGQALFPADLRVRLLCPDLAKRTRPIDERLRLLAAGTGDALTKLLRYETMTYLPLDILTKVDRMTMAHSLEARPPFLDHHLIEAVFAMPSSLKIEGSEQKVVLKHAVADLIPRRIRNRRKQGFGVPIHAWFRGPLREPLRDVLESSNALSRGWLNDREVRALLAEHFSGRRDHALRLWGLLVLELWSRRVLDAPSALRSVAVAHG